MRKTFLGGEALSLGSSLAWVGLSDWGLVLILTVPDGFVVFLSLEGNKFGKADSNLLDKDELGLLGVADLLLPFIALTQIDELLLL